MSQTWSQCLTTLKDTVSLAQFNVWIQPLEPTETKNTLTLLAPNQKTKNYIDEYLFVQIKKTLLRHNKKLALRIIANENQITKSKQQHYTSTLLEEYTFDNLIQGDANQIVCNAAHQIAQNIKNSPYNPFIIYGNSGLGKTHIMQAIGHLAKKSNPKLKIIYLPLMDFVKNLTASIRHNNIDATKNYYQSADLLLVDDIHLIAGKGKSQEEFFHIFNFLFNGKKQIVFTCDQIPNNIKTLEDRLKTRFSQGLNLQVTPPELEMRAAILLKKSQNHKINIDLNEESALFIAANITSNVRDLEGALLKLKASVDFLKISTITKEVIETALQDLIKPANKNLDILDIQKQVAKHYAITVSDLISKSRKQHIVLARQLAIYICHESSNWSLTKIGKHFGNKDHSTVINSIKRIKERFENSLEIKDDYNLIKLKLNNF
jgi:chromosomal replication initiator protein